MTGFGFLVGGGGGKYHTYVRQDYSNIPVR